jgi:hypothetical protein
VQQQNEGLSLSPPGRSGAHDALGAAALVGAVAVVFSPTLGADFVNWDDDRFFTDNPLFHGPVGRYVIAALTRIQFEGYHPLHLLSYLPDRLLWPRHAAGFHALNVALFATAVVLAFLLLRRVTALAPALLACLLFACHPAAVEPVAWITGRKDVLAAVLVLAVLHVEDRTRAHTTVSSLSLALTTAAYLTKTSTLVLPFFIYGWHRWVRDDPRALRRAAPSAALAIAVAPFVVLIWRSHQMFSAERPVALPLDVAGTFGFYLRHTLLPGRLAAVYPPLPDGHRLAGYLVLVGAVVVAALAIKRGLPPAARFALAVFIGALLPVSNVFSLGFRFADRYQLLALVALLWPCAALLAWSLARPARAAAAVVLSLTLATAAAVQASRLARTWHDSLSLWTRATGAQPRAFYAWLKLGESQRALHRWTDAAGSYTRAIELEPQSALGYAGLFLSVASRSEEQGRVPPGSAERWAGRLGGALAAPAAVDDFAAELRAAGCLPCAHSVLWLGLRKYPRSDAALEATARTVLPIDPGAALLLLHEMRAPTPAAGELRQAARAALAAKAAPRPR